MSVWVRSIGGMKVTEENGSTRKEIFPMDTWSTTNRTCIGMGFKPGHRGERPATDVLNHGMVT